MLWLAAKSMFAPLCPEILSHRKHYSELITICVTTKETQCFLIVLKEKKKNHLNGVL
jgi:hypothetical protein